MANRYGLADMGAASLKSEERRITAMEHEGDSTPATAGSEIIVTPER